MVKGLGVLDFGVQDYDRVTDLGLGFKDFCVVSGLLNLVLKA